MSATDKTSRKRAVFPVVGIGASAGGLEAFDLYPAHPAFRTQDNRIDGVVMTLVDVTGRERAAERFRLVVEAAPMAAVVVNKAGEIVFVNARTEQLFFGYERQELIGKPVEILVPERFGRTMPACAGPTSRTPSPG